MMDDGSDVIDPDPPEVARARAGAAKLRAAGASDEQVSAYMSEALGIPTHPNDPTSPHLPGFAAETTSARPKAGPPPEAPTETSVPGAFGAHAGNEGVFGAGPKIVGVMKAIAPTWKPRGTIAEDYTSGRDAAQHYLDQTAKEHPTASTAGDVSGALASAVIPSLVTGGGSLVAGGAKMGMRGLVGQGMAYGAASAAGHSQADDVGGFVKDVARGAGIGGAGGLAAGVAIPMLGKVGERLGRTAAGRAALAKVGVEMDAAPTAAAKLEIAQAFQRDNLTGADLADRAAEGMGTFAPVRAIDVGKGNVRGLARRIADQPGEGSAILRSSIEDRLGDKSSLALSPQTQRVRTAVGDALGAKPENLADVENALIASQKQTSKVNYGAARQQGAVDVPLFQETLDHPQFGPYFQKAHDEGVRLAQMAGEKVPYTYASTPNSAQIAGLDAPGRLVRQPTVTTLDYMKRGLDNVIEGKAEGTKPLGPYEAKLLRGRLGDILGQLDEQSPAYAAARESHATSASAIDALNAGRGTLDKNNRFANFSNYGSVAPEVTAQEVAAMTPEQRALYQRGVFGNVDAGLRGRGFNLNPVKGVAGNDLDTQQLVAAINDPAKSDPLMKGLEWENRIRGSGDRTFGGSETSANIAQKNSGSSKIMSFLRQLYSPRRAAFSGAANLGADIKAAAQPAIDREGAKLLTSIPDQQFLDMISKALRGEQTRDAIGPIAARLGGEEVPPMLRRYLSGNPQ